MNKIIVIVGPTASGKTDLSIKLASHLNTEIISADSLQIYKEFNICTSKPSIEQMKQIKHHLIGHISVTQDYSVFSFVKDAEKCISEISKKNKVPIIVGGTGLYIDALTKNFQLVENRYEDFTSDIKNEDLHNILFELDPVSAKYINKNDFKRLRNAINFYKKNNRSIYTQKQNTDSAKKKFEILKFGLNFKDRKKLYDRINLRVDEMLSQGLLDEINKVRKMKVSKTASAAIGFNDLLPFFEGHDLNDLIEKMKQKTRRYAKRQITWFKKCNDTNWIFADNGYDLDNILNKIYEEKFNIQNEN